MENFPTSRSRDYLVEQLIASPGKLHVLHAPAGYGKTRLLAQIRQACRERGFDVFDGHPADAVAAPRTWLIIDEPVGASIDVDAMRVRLDAGRGDGTGVVIATRHVARLPLARLLAEGDAIRLGPRQIATSYRESVAYLKSRVDERKAQWLAQLADGWTIAIEILGKYARDPHAFFDQEGDFLAASGLGAYIDQELLATLPDGCSSALLFASIVSSCDRAMLDAIRPDDDLGRHLAVLREQAPGLIEARDNQTIINPMLRLHLRRRFDQLPSAERQAALELASRRCVAVGQIGEAAGLVARTGDPRAIVNFIRRSQGLRLWVSAGFAVIRDIVTKAGLRGLEEEPRLRLLACLVHVKDGRISDAERLFQQVLPELADDDETKRDIEIVRTTLLICGCHYSSPADIDSFRRYAMRDSDDPAWKSLIHSMQGVLAIQSGELDNAMSHIVEAEKFTRAAGSELGLLFLGIHRINVALARGDLERARTLLGHARRAWRQRFAAETGVGTILDALTACLEFEGGRLSSARVHMRRATAQLPNAEAWLEIHGAVYEPMARLLCVDIGLPATIASLEARQRELRADGLDRVARLVDRIGACLEGEAALRGAPSAGLASPLPKPPEAQALSWQERELFALAEAYHCLAGGEHRQAIDVLRRLIDFAEPKGLRRSSLRARLLMVAALDQQERRGEADRVFEEALELGMQTGMHRALVEFGGDAVRERLGAKLDAMRAAASSDPHLLKFSRSLARWQPLPAAEKPARFTAREADVLGLLERGGSDKLIGRKLGVTEHAVRYHLKNIYRKLHVHDRVEAVCRAREAAPLR